MHYYLVDNCQNSLWLKNVWGCWPSLSFRKLESLKKWEEKLCFCVYFLSSQWNALHFQWKSTHQVLRTCFIQVRQPMRLQGSSGCIRHLTQHPKSPSNEPAVSCQLLSLEWAIWKVNANSSLLSESEWCANGPEVFWSRSRGMLGGRITRKNFLINQEACVHGQMVSTPSLIYFK